MAACRGAGRGATGRGAGVGGACVAVEMLAAWWVRKAVGAARPSPYWIVDEAGGVCVCDMNE